MLLDGRGHSDSCASIELPRNFPSLSIHEPVWGGGL